MIYHENNIVRLFSLLQPPVVNHICIIIMVMPPGIVPLPIPGIVPLPIPGIPGIPGISIVEALDRLVPGSSSQCTFVKTAARELC